MRHAVDLTTTEEPPAANRYWRLWRGRLVVSDEARAYRERLRLEARRAWGRRFPVFPTGDVSVVLVWYRAARRGDVDGRIKVILDALQGTLYANDAQVSALAISRVNRPRQGGMFLYAARVPTMQGGGR